MAELLQISFPPPPDRKLDVVFVHGLGGHPLLTWRSGDDETTSWPHWLAEDFGSQIGVWSLGYAASPSKWRGIKAFLFRSKDTDVGASMSLYRRAENVLDRLVSSGIGQRPLCFITHSLGGLLVKALLRRAADSQDVPERHQIVERCRGVLFLATPHHGSRLADLASAINFYLPTVSTEDLKENDDHLIDLYEWYRRYAPWHNILTYSYYENKQTKGIVVVVPRYSADPGISGPIATGPTPLDKDHLDISKPINREDQDYLASRSLTRRVLAEGLQPNQDTFQPEAADVYLAKPAIEGILVERIDSALQQSFNLKSEAPQPNSMKAGGSVVLTIKINDQELNLDQAWEIIKAINLSTDGKATITYIAHGSTCITIEGPRIAMIRALVFYDQGRLERDINSRIAGRGDIKEISIAEVRIVQETASYEKSHVIFSLQITNNRRVRKGPYYVTESTVRKNLSGNDLSGANLVGLDLRRFNFSRANLSGAWFARPRPFDKYMAYGMSLEGPLPKQNRRSPWRPQNEGSSLVGSILTKANLTRANLYEADLSHCTFHQSNLANADLRDASAHNAIFLAADLCGADLSAAYMGHAIFNFATLTSATIRNADLDYSSFRHANLELADLSGSFFCYSDFTCASLVKTLLLGANLTGAILKDVDCSGANFRFADLTDVDFSHAKLRGCIFGDNTGLNQEHKQSFEARGAIIIDTPGEDASVAIEE